MTPAASAPGRLRIRSARPSDLPVLVGLLETLFSIEADFLPDPERHAMGLHLLLARPPGEARVAVADDPGGGVVGMATAQVLVSTAQGTPAALLEDVVVDPSWRGRGIGRRLLEDLEGWARAQGASRLQLLADRENAPALRFYDAVGWEPTRLVCLRRRL